MNARVERLATEKIALDDESRLCGLKRAECEKAIRDQFGGLADIISWVGSSGFFVVANHRLRRGEKYAGGGVVISMTGATAETAKKVFDARAAAALSTMKQYIADERLTLR